MGVDMWSLGIMFYELVCGRLPFGDSADDEQEVLASILENELTFPSRYNDSAGKTPSGSAVQAGEEPRRRWRERLGGDQGAQILQGRNRREPFQQDPWPRDRAPCCPIDGTVLQ